MAHQLSPVQKAMKLMEMPDLGDRQPSQLLADLLQMCPPGEQSSAFFHGSFIKRLPSELQVHLAHKETADLKKLAQRADQLWLTHRRKSAVATVDVGGGMHAEDKLLVAAVQQKGKGKQQKKKKLITYCYLHHKNGKDACKCESPASCMWAEN
jgi:hypothetical protein